jgi:hypothetical protein
VITTSFLNDPIFVNTPLTQVVNDYQTTITAVLNGGATVYQRTFSVPFNAVSVQNGIAIPTPFSPATEPLSALPSGPRTPRLWYRA